LVITSRLAVVAVGEQAATDSRVVLAAAAGQTMPVAQALQLLVTMAARERQRLAALVVVLAQ
jgi:hypothetical protein